MSPATCAPVRISRRSRRSRPVAHPLLQTPVTDPTSASIAATSLPEGVCLPSPAPTASRRVAPFLATNHTCPASDLLSRHINKCHASEKPPTTTAPSRRKGSAAASRATTSKQACDQCVPSSLPCDGANPCCESLHVLSSLFVSPDPWPQPNASSASAAARTSSSTARPHPQVLAIQCPKLSRPPASAATLSLSALPDYPTSSFSRLRRVR